MSINVHFAAVGMHTFRDKWVPVTTAWRVLRLRMEERPPIWRVAVKILNKQSQTADKGWSCSLGLDEVLTTPHRKKRIKLRNSQRVSLVCSGTCG